MFLSKYKKLITRALAIDTSRPVSKNKGVMSADQSAQSAPRAIIGAGVKMEGQIVSRENIVVDGLIKGGIIAEDHQVLVSDSGVVKGNIHASVVLVQGSVTGDITANQNVVIAASGNIIGNIESPRVTLQDGAKFKGSIEMDPGQPTQVELLSSVKAGRLNTRSSQAEKKAS
ncbi:MAG: polymer-forming cytoskeletal protein [Porticoccaceae bacterium]|jgi:cytoskeletal protein CcmA (bactofilin family)|nr:polymer-forming cytoskeletal protein [Porticoccaceae bacterium]MBT6027849.1 polymer-forming cytoskeletal protein [Porticoccaceae bacterium]MBT6421652.1 polymer-forming cytoskeletal protein [Porticoccaceae bacterium]MBT7167708.1 polymer-forming cytoskeletal protein [Porticoccaceae bacterium]MBT7566207.1 polymer-forming cytoskeletal protein [Porticoccaceae bacterium]|tara:strand:+ start:378 stop:893 length:516 start_codon:yes stop_codon:yes gene_type:complete